MSPVNQGFWDPDPDPTLPPSGIRSTMTHPYDEPTGECRKSAESATKPRLELRLCYLARNLCAS
jgi:hypothetical protein